MMPETPDQFEYFMYRAAFHELLQTLVSAGSIAKGDATMLCENLAGKARGMPVKKEIEGYRDMVASHYEAISEMIV